MSLDYKKKVYVPQRDETRKSTSYGSMNQWHDYSTPVSDKLRPRATRILEKEHAHKPLPSGADLHIPSPRELTPLSRAVQEHRRKVAERNEREIRQRFGVAGPGAHESGRRLAPLARSQDTTAYRAENTLADGSIIIAGRRVVPDPMTQGAPVHLSYSHTTGYDDYHKTFLKLQKEGVYPSYPLYGAPRLRNGRNGGSWRHVKEVMQAHGYRTVFVDGSPRQVENLAMADGKVPGSELFYPIKSDNGPLGRKRKGRALTSPPTHMLAHDKYQYRQTEGPNWHVVR